MGLILKLAFRNLWLHRFRTFALGSIILFGTILAVVGDSLVEGVARGISQSVINSAVGHLQIYSKDAKEKLSVFGDMGGNTPDIGHVQDYGHVKKVLMESVGNIEQMVPMGTKMAFMTPGNLLDQKLELLRKKYDLGLAAHVLSIIKDVQSDVVRNQELFSSSKDPVLRESQQNVSRVLNDSYWKTLATATPKAYANEIEFLENRIAPLIFDNNQLYFSYIGTVPGIFAKTFSDFEMVKGQMIPEGKKGFLFSDFYYEKFVKNRVAHRLDDLHAAVFKDHKKIAQDTTLRDWVRSNQAQAAEVYSQIPPARAQELEAKLLAVVKIKEDKIAEAKTREGLPSRFSALVWEFLATTDENIGERYAFFYKEIAPSLELYRIRVGDSFPLGTLSKTGFFTSINARLYGTFRFKSFESSPLAGNFSLLDMISFRQLYGFMTEERRAENSELANEMNTLDVGRTDIESLFGSAEPTQAKPAAKPLAQPKAAAPLMSAAERRDRDLNAHYSPEEFENGVFIHAAIRLKDPEQLDKTMKLIKEVSDAKGLGLQAVRWDDAAGIIGQFAKVFRGLLFGCVAIIFVVASFIFTNSMFMAALERTKEIGTMRAIGAQGRLIFWILMTEGVVLALVFGLAGAALGSGIVLYLGSVGIPAMGEIATFFFSGPRLYPKLEIASIFWSLGGMTLLAFAATQFPALRAMKVTPLEAMNKN